MDSAKMKAVLEHVVQIGAAIRTLRDDVDAKALQVGERQFLDRSLAVVENEVRALSRYLEGMLEDSTKF
jgi:hypothetical protein